MKHTKGPWHTDENFSSVWDSRRASAEICRMPSATSNLENNEANARLIAAAPELLESLKELTKQVESNSRKEPLTKVFFKALNIIRRIES